MHLFSPTPILNNFIKDHSINRVREFLFEALSVETTQAASVWPHRAPVGSGNHLDILYTPFLTA